MLTITNFRINHRQGWLAVTSGLLLLLLLLSFPHVHADTLPSVITSGYTMSMDGVMGTNGTILDVPAMLRNASSAGNGTAIFNASGLEFQGTLTITCPTTTTEWTTTNLQVYIVNGKTTTSIGSIPNPHINVTGVLSLGSSITIDGGMYTYNRDFILFLSILAGGSSLLVRNTVLLPRTTYGVSASLLHVSTGSHVTNPLTISDNSAISISNNTVSTDNVTMNADWYIMNIVNRPLQVTNNSRVSIVSNTMSANGITKSNTWNVDLAVLRLSGSPLNISDNSAVTINANTVVANNSILSGDWTVMVAQWSPILVTNSSRVSIHDNTMAATNTTAFGGRVVLQTSISPMAISHNSVVAIYNNGITADNVVVFGQSDLWSVVTVESLDVSFNSAVFVVDNSITAGNLTMTSRSYVMNLKVLEASPLAISDNSSVSIVDNTVSVQRTTNSGENWMWSVLSSGSTISITGASNLSTRGNVMSASQTAVSMSLMLVVIMGFTESAISDNSTMSIVDNAMLVSGVTARNSWKLYMLFAFATIKMTNYSALTATNNNMVMSNTSVERATGEWGWYGLNLVGAIISVSSTVTCSHNSMEVNNATSGGPLEWHWFYIGSDLLSLSDSSAVSITNNNMTANALGVGDCLWTVLYAHSYYRPVSFLNQSRVSLSDNTMTATNITAVVPSGDVFTDITVVPVWNWNVLYSWNQGISDKSTMSIANNTMSYNGSTTPTMGVVVVELLDVSGMLSVVGNVMQEGTVVVTSNLSGSGVVEATNNVVDGAGYVFNANVTGNTSVTIHTCTNYVNTNTLCYVLVEHYTCSEGTGVDGHVQDCEPPVATTTTTTATTTPSTTGDTLVDFATVNHTTAAQLQKEVDPYGGSVTSNIQATEDGTHTYVVSFPDAAEADRAIAAANRGELPGVTGAKPHSNPSPSPSSPPSKTGLIVGVSVGASVAVLLIVGVVWYVRRGKNSDVDDGYHTPIQD